MPLTPEQRESFINRHQRTAPFSPPPSSFRTPYAAQGAVPNAVPRSETAPLSGKEAAYESERMASAFLGHTMNIDSDEDVHVYTQFLSYVTERKLAHCTDTTIQKFILKAINISATPGLLEQLVDGGLSFLPKMGSFVPMIREELSSFTGPAKSQEMQNELHNEFLTLMDAKVTNVIDNWDNEATPKDQIHNIIRLLGEFSEAVGYDSDIRAMYTAKAIALLVKLNDKAQNASTKIFTQMAADGTLELNALMSMITDEITDIKNLIKTDPNTVKQEIERRYRAVQWETGTDIFSSGLQGFAILATLCGQPDVARGAKALSETACTIGTNLYKIFEGAVAGAPFGPYVAIAGALVNLVATVIGGDPNAGIMSALRAIQDMIIELRAHLDTRLDHLEAQLYQFECRVLDAFTQVNLSLSDIKTTITELQKEQERRFDTLERQMLSGFKAVYLKDLFQTLFEIGLTGSNLRPEKFNDYLNTLTTQFQHTYNSLVTGEEQSREAFSKLSTTESIPEAVIGQLTQFAEQQNHFNSTGISGLLIANPIVLDKLVNAYLLLMEDNQEHWHEDQFHITHLFYYLVSNVIQFFESLRATPTLLLTAVDHLAATLTALETRVAQVQREWEQQNVTGPQNIRLERTFSQYKKNIPTASVPRPKHANDWHKEFYIYRICGAESAISFTPAKLNIEIDPNNLPDIRNKHQNYGRSKSVARRNTIRRSTAIISHVIAFYRDAVPLYQQGNIIINTERQSKQSRYTETPLPLFSNTINESTPLLPFVFPSSSTTIASANKVILGNLPDGIVPEYAIKAERLGLGQINASFSIEKATGIDISICFITSDGHSYPIYQHLVTKLVSSLKAKSFNDQSYFFGVTRPISPVWCAWNLGEIFVDGLQAEMAYKGHGRVSQHEDIIGTRPRFQAIKDRNLVNQLNSDTQQQSKTQIENLINEATERYEQEISRTVTNDPEVDRLMKDIGYYKHIIQLILHFAYRHEFEADVPEVRRMLMTTENSWGYGETKAKIDSFPGSKYLGNEINQQLVMLNAFRTWEETTPAQSPQPREVYPLLSATREALQAFMNTQKTVLECNDWVAPDFPTLLEQRRSKFYPTRENTTTRNATHIPSTTPPNAAVSGPRATADGANSLFHALLGTNAFGFYHCATAKTYRDEFLAWLSQSNHFDDLTADIFRQATWDQTNSPGDMLKETLDDNTMSFVDYLNSIRKPEYAFNLAEAIVFAFYKNIQLTVYKNNNEENLVKTIYNADGTLALAACNINTIVVNSDGNYEYYLAEIIPGTNAHIPPDEAPTRTDDGYEAGYIPPPSGSGVT